MRPTAALIASVLAAGALGAPASARVRTVRLEDSFFSPSTLRVRPGAIVRWAWSGELAHNLSGPGIRRGYLIPAVRHSPTAVRFTRRGTFRYECTIHPGMRMSVRVR